MSRILDVDSMEALLTSRTVVGSCLSYDDDESLVGTWTNLSTRSCSGSPYKLPGNTTLPQSYSYSALGSLSSCGGTPCRGQKSLMTDLDKRIYNSLGSTSSPIGKVGFIIISYYYYYYYFINFIAANIF